jgi:glycosyltransferase involved in cell wall biosynthesis
MPKVSVIIPCYNSGKFIEDTVDSVLASSFTDFEIIIVNDGSTDEHTNQVLANFNKPKTKIITTQNQGVVKARNTAVNNSSGKYILPLDADDKISPDYMKLAVQYLDIQPALGIVYCNVEMFGAKSGPFILPDYTVETMLKQSIIIVSAFFRREDFDKIGGWDPEMDYFYEDWDFWISIIELGREVYKIRDTHFYYRMVPNSRTHTRDWAEGKNVGVLLNRLYKKHVPIYVKYFPDPLTLTNELNRTKADYEKQLNGIYNSRDYRLGKKILNPLRKFKSLFRK